MDIPEPGKQTDDQELAKVLAGVDEQLNSAGTDLDAALSFEETPTPTGSFTPPAFPPVEPLVAPVDNPVSEPVVAGPQPSPADEPSHKKSHKASPSQSGDLASIKKDALDELRPLVDKLEVSAEEKFDTYLMLLRSTDDQALIAPAHEAAKAITDETRRAQALLDVVKEIDYLTADK